MTTKEQLKPLIASSNSDTIVRQIASQMKGKTFHHHYHILYDIRTLLGPEPKTYMEIGTYCGGSVCLILSHAFPTSVHCIDPLHVLPNQEGIVRENIQTYNTNNYPFYLYKQFSTNPVLIQTLKDTQIKTDILFIDGDHSYHGVINDFTYFSPLVRPGGFIVFDDYHDYVSSPQVKKAVDDIVARTETKEQYEIVGDLPNLKQAYSAYPLQCLNEFIIRKK